MEPQDKLTQFGALTYRRMHLWDEIQRLDAAIVQIRKEIQQLSQPTEASDVPDSER